MIYVIREICGEYATLISQNGDEIFIAMALLPFDCNVGDKLLFENFSYTKIQ